MFEDLFPEPHEKIIQNLLFVLCSWHALAKLRMHTESTLSRLDALTTELGKAIRQFSEVTCVAFVTHELPREQAARARRQSQKNKGTSQTGTPSTSPRTKAFNVSTPKLHALGDYVAMIRQFGTTDSYSTQSVNALIFYFSPP